MSANKNRWDKLAVKNAVNEQTKQEKNAILDNIASNTHDNTQDNTQSKTNNYTQDNVQDNIQDTVQNKALNSTQSNTQSSTQATDQSNTQPNTQFSNFVHQMDIQKHKTVEQTHTRKNYLIKNEIVAQLEKESEKHPRGWPTKLINGLLESYFLELKRLREEK